VERLKHRPDFLRCARGLRRTAAGVTLEIAPTPQPFARPDTVRLGFTATKKTVGGAVDRNRAKRRLRAAAAVQVPLYGAPGNDYVLVARAATITRPFANLLEDVAVTLQAARMKLASRQEP
jgi:ribonuclease P protein component